MGRWDPLPPSAYQIAENAVLLQMVCACLAVACVALLIFSLQTDGSRSASVSPGISTLVFLGLLWQVRIVARYVADYDRHHESGPARHA
jgi:hypothetical protein